MFRFAVWLLPACCLAGAANAQPISNPVIEAGEKAGMIAGRAIGCGTPQPRVLAALDLYAARQLTEMTTSRETIARARGRMFDAAEAEIPKAKQNQSICIEALGEFEALERRAYR